VKPFYDQQDCVNEYSSYVRIEDLWGTQESQRQGGCVNYLVALMEVEDSIRGTAQTGAFLARDETRYLSAERLAGLEKSHLGAARCLVPRIRCRSVPTVSRTRNEQGLAADAFVISRKR